MLVREHSQRTSAIRGRRGVGPKADIVREVA